MSTNHSGSLEEQVGKLHSRLRRVEEALSRQGILPVVFLCQPPSAPPSAYTKFGTIG